VGKTQRTNLIKVPNSTTNPLYLVIDQGGHASRAFVFNRDGKVLAQGSSPIEAQVNKDAKNQVEYDAITLLHSIQHAIHEAIASPNIKLNDIVSAGMATQRSNVVCWDRVTGQPLSPIISWQDRRAADWVKQFKSHEEQVHHATGLFLSAHYGVGKLKWCYENLPAVAQAHQQQRLCWGPMTSFLLNQLLDEKPYLVDHVNASRTLLWNIKTHDWDPMLAQLFDLPSAPLPECVANQYPFGTLTIENHNIPMTTVIGDQSASLFAWQQLQNDALYVNIGTGAFIQRVINSDCIIEPHLLTSLLIKNGGNACYALEGTVNGAGSALSWIEQQLQPNQLYQQLPQWLEANDCPLLFLNGVSGIGSPYWQANFKSRFIGDGDDTQKIVAVIESIAFLLQINIEALQQQQPAARKILISGGLTRLNGLCQRIANLSSLTVQRMAAAEGTASGMAWLLAHSNKDCANNEQWNCESLTEFSPTSNPALVARYQHWTKALSKALDKPPK